MVKNKVKCSYIARQPILDSKRNTFAYELLFRDGPENAFPKVNPEQATSRLLSDNFLSPSSEFLNQKLAFVNFPHKSIINLIPSLFSNNKFVIEILEDCIPDDELFEAITTLHTQGYLFALDDFVPSKEWTRFIPLISFIKFDIQYFPIEKSAPFIRLFKNKPVKFIAEKVETYHEFTQANDAGFHYFQGYFFSRPEMQKTTTIEPSFLVVVQLMKAIANEHLDFKKVEQIISQDVSLSYKLLRYVNDSHSISVKIKSFNQALAYLGEERLRRFVLLVAVASTNESKPDSLFSLAIQRARFSELIVQHSCYKLEKNEAFLVGMFSLLDSLLDQPLQQLVKELSIDDNIKKALLEHEGYLGQVLNLVIAYESAEWDSIKSYQSELEVTDESLLNCYQDSLRWANDTAAS